MTRRTSFLLIFLSIGIACAAQMVQVNRENRTISVTADDTVSADAEVAILSIGVHNSSPSKDTAYQDNLRAAEKVVKALLETGVPRENVQTDNIQLGKYTDDEESKTKREVSFDAHQSWRVQVPVKYAQGVVDAAVRAGANEISDIDWQVVDPIALQAKAGSAALAKARRVAEQMAAGLGAKLGSLVYASNRAPSAYAYFGFGGGIVNTSVSTVGKAVHVEPQLTLYPKKVKSEATVYAVFAIE